MKKLFLALGTLLISLCATTTAYAGSINSNESAVLSAAEGTYQYKGKDYKVDPTYISELRGYLMSDDVDLTAEQSNKALGSISGNIENGVQGGYLIPVGGKSDQGGTNPGTGNSSPDTNQGNSGQGTVSDGNTGSPSTGTDNSTPNNSTSDNSGNNNTDTSNDNPGNNGTTQDNDNSTGTKVDNDSSSKDADDFIEDMILGNDPADKASSSQVSDNDINSSDDITADSNKDISLDSNEATENSIIKDTGFDLSATLAMVIVMGVIMISGILVTIKYKYFAQYDES